MKTRELLQKRINNINSYLAKGTLPGKNIKLSYQPKIGYSIGMYCQDVEVATLVSHMSFREIVSYVEGITNCLDFIA
jgi:hypothetical protein